MLKEKTVAEVVRDHIARTIGVPLADLADDDVLPYSQVQLVVGSVGHYYEANIKLPPKQQTTTVQEIVAYLEARLQPVAA